MDNLDRLVLNVEKVKEEYLSNFKRIKEENEAEIKIQTTKIETLKNKLRGIENRWQKFSINQKQLNESRERLRKLDKELVKEIEHLKKEQKEVENFRLSNNLIKKDLESLHKSWDELNLKLSSQEISPEQVKQFIRIVEESENYAKQLEELKNNYPKIKKDVENTLTNWNNKFNDFFNERTEMTKKCKCISAKINETKIALKEIGQKTDQLTTKKDLLQNSIQKYENKIQILMKSCNELKNELNSVINRWKEEGESIFRKVGTIGNRFEANISTLNLIEQKSMENSEIINHLKNSEKSLEENVSKQKKEYYKLKSQYKALNQNLTNKILELQNTLNKGSKQISKQYKFSENLIEVIDKTDDDLMSLSEKLKTLESSKDSIKSRVLSYSNKLKQLRNDYKDFKSNIKNITSEVQDLIKTHSKTTEELKKSCDRYKSVLDGINNKSEETGKKITSLVNKSKTLTEYIKEQNKLLELNESKMNQTEAKKKELNTLIEETSDHFRKYFKNAEEMDNILEMIKKDRRKVICLTGLASSSALIAVLIMIISFVL